MKFTPAVLAAFAGLVAAQDLSAIPECARECINTAVTSSTNCQLTEIACICNSIESVTAGATACVLAACGADVAIGQVLPATAELCAQVLPNGPSSAAPAPGSTTSGSAGTTTITSTGGPATVTTSRSSSAGDDDDNQTTVTTPTPTEGFQSPSTTATTSTSTAGAASFGAVGSFGMLLMGAVAAL
ncbi:hypothetical protein QBC34DRAFT_496666 [Podospora aff. communis PSN243]|uniref:CFEM domain-containing protein n=1 Tax=Podospora aff. communis PSN243 TaxID=3040156 RepID=A0AAV9GEK4_9PEZI|nr:hypothetical protein QBC34DRAFT_496666 [Podospora aff. communis PSN243]